MTPGEKLCLACGLCCDGTLFDNVQLGSGDDAKAMRARGLPVTVARAKSARPITLFRQPCAALCADRTCRVYADRPLQCRDFECGVFKAAQDGRITFAAAQAQVRRARRQADHIRGLLRELGDHDEHRSLRERFRRTQRRLESDGAGQAEGTTFADLSQAVHAFSLLTHDKFYTRPDTP